MKKIVVVVVVVMMMVGLVACGNSSDQTMSDKKYQEIMDDMGIKGAESVIENAEIKGGIKRMKVSEEDYEYDSVWKKLAEFCGEQKKNVQYGFYALSEDEEQASIKREAYKNYLQEQGYEFQSTDDVYGDIYIKGSYAVMIPELGDPIKWSEDSEKQYSLHIYFY